MNPPHQLDINLRLDLTLTNQSLFTSKALSLALRDIYSNSNTLSTMLLVLDSLNACEWSQNEVAKRNIFNV